MCEMPEEYPYCLNICLTLANNAHTSPMVCFLLFPLISFLFRFLSFPFLSLPFLSFPFLHFLRVCFLFVLFFYFINCLVINYIIEFPRDARDMLSRRGGTKDVQHPGCTEYMYVTHSPLSLRSCSRHCVSCVCACVILRCGYLASCVIVVCVRVVDVVVLSAYRFRLSASSLPPALPSPLSLLIQIIDLRLLKDLGNQMHMDSQVVQKCVGNIQNGLYELNETEASLLASLETLVKPSTPSSSSDSLPRPLSSSDASTKEGTKEGCAELGEKKGGMHTRNAAEGAWSMKC